MLKTKRLLAAFATLASLALAGGASFPWHLPI